MIEIPLEDSSALSYLAEYYRDIDDEEKRELIAKLSPEGKRVAEQILAQDPGADADVKGAAQTLKDWAQEASASR